jgi:hypothetical protein
MITFCIVDDIDSYAEDYIKTTVKNIADYTISNILTKGYKVITGKDEDELLRSVQTDFAVVMSPGTEYINGLAFFEALEELVKKDFFIAGHILDRTMYDAYYELHHQCYVVNMVHYKRLQSPTVGFKELHVSHTQTEPARSLDNIHDNYTPTFVMQGTRKVRYANRCHGWNILRLAFENNLPIIVFEDSIRNNKKHYYPESQEDFKKLQPYIEEKLRYCENEFVHIDNTEWANDISQKFEQVIVPASGMLYTNLATKKIVFYDYNKKSLDYWKENHKIKTDIECIFVQTNLLNDTKLIDAIDSKLKTFVNFSNIFSYEGTVAKYSLPHRINAQENLQTLIKSKISDVYFNYTQEANREILDIASWH